MLGAAAAERLGIDRIYPGERIWLGGQWFYVAGILSSAVLAPEIDTLRADRLPRRQDLPRLRRSSDHDLRPQRDQPGRRRPVACSRATANPEAPNEVDVSQPSAVLTARADAQGALNGLFLGLGAVSLLVGAVGVANIMVISVLERRSEIGLRRALGATKGQIRTQFLSEAMSCSLLGGAVGVALGILATAIYAHTKNWTTVIPALPGQADSAPPLRSARSPGSSRQSAPRGCHRPTRCDRSDHRRQCDGATGDPELGSRLEAIGKPLEARRELGGMLGEDVGDLHGDRQLVHVAALGATPFEQRSGLSERLAALDLDQRALARRTRGQLPAVAHV